ncbi:ABC transporter substrate-binding protein, partial [Streptococcus suis]
TVDFYRGLLLYKEVLYKWAQVEEYMNEFIYRKRAEWIVNGGIEEEWDSYLNELESYGLSDWLAIKQKYYDQYQENQSSKGG